MNLFWRCFEDENNWKYAWVQMVDGDEFSVCGPWLGGVKKRDDCFLALTWSNLVPTNLIYSKYSNLIWSNLFSLSLYSHLIHCVHNINDIMCVCIYIYIYMYIHTQWLDDIWLAHIPCAPFSSNASMARIPVQPAARCHITRGPKASPISNTVS